MPLRDLVEPFYLTRRALRRGIARHARGLVGRVLDVGCGTQPYRELLPECDYIGIEVARASRDGGHSQAHVYFDGHTLPFADGSIDAILCTQVLEHVFEPRRFLDEFRRVLKPGGKLLLTVPFVWDEHEKPYDFARYSSFGLTYITGAAGFVTLASEKTLPNAGALIQLWLAYVQKLVSAWPRPLRMATFLLVATPSNLLGRLLEAASPRNPDLYLDNIFLCERISDEH